VRGRERVERTRAFAIGFRLDPRRRVQAEIGNAGGDRLGRGAGGAGQRVDTYFEPAVTAGAAPDGARDAWRGGHDARAVCHNPQAPAMAGGAWRGRELVLRSAATMPLVRYLASVADECKRVLIYKVRGQQVRFRYPDAQIGYSTLFRFDTVDALRFGSGVIIGPFCEIVVYRKHGLTNVPGSLTLGSKAVISAWANIRAAGGSIEIGDNTLVGQHVSIIGANHGVQAGGLYATLPLGEDRTGVRIGSNVWIGAGSVILPGTSIGDNSLIAAGAVITQDVPAGEIWGGVPARKIRGV
jgi:acetyltransferase-like isoleucine patch superfamily enzyme